MPSRLICQDDSLFDKFATLVEQYLKYFTTENFLNSVTGIANSDNPFTFNETSNTMYMQRHIFVFRRTNAKVDRDLYIDYCKQGLLDPNHTIGKLSHLKLLWNTCLSLSYVFFRGALLRKQGANIDR